MVGKIATGEVGEEVDYGTSKSATGSAGGKARAQHLSEGERQNIAKAGTSARWNKERRVNMTNKERLMTALFDNPQREHVDIKFWLGGGVEINEDALCGEAVKMLDQMDAGQGDTEFVEDFEQREATEFVAK
ncbi:hypothetical protein [uncultured Erythrobacter sp.]|uniref:hypothetical protein n=1 Tax=uncultured Erythrobacter sp. TaxID=263913 RepID=UPI0026249EF4|nr:hypothetical protein [uncultured Erythrobacter sp.]